MRALGDIVAALSVMVRGSTSPTPPANPPPESRTRGYFLSPSDAVPTAPPWTAVNTTSPPAEAVANTAPQRPNTSREAQRNQHAPQPIDFEADIEPLLIRVSSALLHPELIDREVISQEAAAAGIMGHWDYTLENSGDSGDEEDGYYEDGYIEDEGDEDDYGSDEPDGDAVYSDEALARVITDLREQDPPGGPPPASPAVIDQLRARMREVDDEMLGVDSSSGGGGDDAKARCVICVDDMVRGERAAVLACGHLFHGDCVISWLRLRETCPDCRRAVVLQTEEGDEWP